MIGYWLYKFDKDEDVCLVDYQQLEQVEDIELPVVSMCFTNPFLDEKLKEISPSLNSSDYLKYLQGDLYDESFKDIDFDHVTLNL